MKKFAELSCSVLSAFVVFLGVVPSYACLVDSYQITNIKYGQFKNVPAIEITGRVDGGKPFKLYLDDEDGVAAFSTILLNPYYGLTRFPNEKVEGTKPQQNILQNSMPETIEAVNLIITKLLNQRLPVTPEIKPLAKIASNTTYQEFNDKFARIIANELASVVSGKDHRYWVVNEKAKAALSVSPMGGDTQVLSDGKSVAIGQDETYYFSKNIAEAIFATARLGTGGVRGLSMAFTGSKDVEELLISTETKSCLVSLDIEPSLRPFAEVSTYFKNYVDQPQKSPLEELDREPIHP